MSSDEKESRSDRHNSVERRRDSPPRKDRRDKRRRSRNRSDEDEERHSDRRDNRRDYHDRRRRSRSPRDRHHRRNDRQGDKPIIPQRPKLFQRATADDSASTSKGNEDPNQWSMRIAAVASDDGQRSKFEKLLGMHKKDSAKPALKSVTDEDKKKMQKELSKMEHDLDTQFEQSRAFTHSFRGRGL